MRSSDCLDIEMVRPNKGRDHFPTGKNIPVWAILLSWLGFKFSVFSNTRFSAVESSGDNDGGHPVCHVFILENNPIICRPCGT